MKKTLIYLTLFLTLAYSCKKESNDTASVKGFVKLSVSKAALQAVDTATSYIGVVTITDQWSNELYSNKILTLTKVGGYYKSDSLSINSGSYYITKFVIYNSQWQGIYASPKKDSKYAKYGLALPIGFIMDATVDASNKTETVGFTRDVRPTLLSAKDSLPADYGYGSFHYKASSATSFQLATYENFFDDTYFYCTAKLEVTTDSFKYVRNLKAGANTLSLPNLGTDLKFQFTAAGYDTVITTIKRDTLAKYLDHPLLIFVAKKP